MKKVLTFVMMLSCTIAAMAQMSFNVATLEENDQNAELMVRPFSQSKIAYTNEVLQFDPAYRAQFEENYRASEFYFAAQTSTRKAALGTPITNTVDTVIATYLTNYYYYVEGQSTNPTWTFIVKTKELAKYAFSVQGLSSREIACSYAIDNKKNYGIYVSETNDTLSLTGGMFKIVVDTVINNIPYYFFSGNFTDQNGDTHTLEANPIAYAFEEGTAMDMFFVYACLVTRQATYCNAININLADKKINPSGEKHDVEIVNNAFVRRTQEGYIVVAQDKDTYFQTFLRSTKATPAGEYISDSIDLVQTYFLDFETIDKKIDTTYHVIYQCLSAKVETTAEGYSYLVSILDTLGDQYNFTFFDTVRVITDTVNVSYAYGNYYDYTSTSGVFRAVGLSGDSLQVSFAVSTDKIIGQYTTMDSYADGGYDYVLLKRNSGVYRAKVDTITIEAAKGTDAAKFDYIATIQYLAQNTKDAKDVKWFKIRFCLISFFQPDQAADVEQTYDLAAGDKLSLNTSLYQTYGCLVMQFLKSDSTDMFYTQVFTDSIDQENLLPAGDYPVVNTGSFPSVYASSGYNVLTGKIAPTFYGKLNASRQIEKVWFVVDGTMTVETGFWKLEGLNSKGKNVTINVKLPTTGINQINATNAAEANKVMRNGQLLIIKNGKLYNAQGAQIAE